MSNDEILSALAMGDKHECIFPDERKLTSHEHPLDPCRFRVSEIYRNVTVEVLTCPICGAVSISWRRQEDTEKVVMEDSK